jgi:hypothetical protein
MDKQKETYIWGAGHYGVLTAVRLENEGVKIKGFIDKNAKEIKTRLGLPVLEPDLLMPSVYVVIAIQNEDSITQVKNYLAKKGLKDGINFEVSKEVLQAALRYKLPGVRILQTMADRLFTTKTYNKDSFKLKENAFEKIYENNLWSSLESKSGPGSEIAVTVKIRKALPYLWKKYNIKTFLDVPCGDFNWMKEVDKDEIQYIGGDIVEQIVDKNNSLYRKENVSFKKIDITKDTLPCVDMIFCRDCLLHLSFEKIHKALKNFVTSGSTYLLTSSHPFTLKNYDILDGDFRELNLFKVPFNLPENYLYRIREIAEIEKIALDRSMYLWRLSDI